MRKTFLLVVLISLFALTISTLGCDDNETDGDADGDADGDGDCIVATLNATDVINTARTDEQRWSSLRTLTVNDGEELYILDLSAFVDTTVGNVVEVGSHELGTGPNEDPHHCLYCVMLYHCEETGCGTFSQPTYDNWYFAVSGTLVIDELGTTDGGAFSGEIQDVTFSRSGTSTRDCFQVSSYSFSYSPVEAW